MKHIVKRDENEMVVGSMCGFDKSRMFEIVEGAMESDCDECRVAVGVARVGDKSWDGRAFGVAQAVAYQPESPLVDEDGREYERKKL